MKHAYLIIAHNEYEILGHLLKALDDDRNDIFIHWDAKVENPPAFKVNHAGLYYTDMRIDVRWGDFSVVEAEYALFETATKKDSYIYYHLLSGVDMPLHSQDYIHRFFEDNAGKQFIGFSNYDGWREEVTKKMRWHLFPKKFQKEFRLSASSALRSVFLKLQDLLNIKRGHDVEIRKGTQWISVTDDFARYMLIKHGEVCRVFSHTFCSDEMFAQTLCWNSQYRDDIYDINDEGHGSQRAIGWKNGVLYPWTMKDYDYLMNSNAIFARKFSSKDMDVVDRLLKNVTE